MVRIVIALGSNLQLDPNGLTPRDLVIAGWRATMASLGLAEAKLSSLIESQPAEQATGGTFINAVGIGTTALSATATLQALQTIERDYGRDRSKEGHHGARTLDLDLIDHGGAIITSPSLTLPHPSLAQRDFVLVPLAEVAPHWRWPGDGRTAVELLPLVTHPALLGARPVSGAVNATDRPEEGAGRGWTTAAALLALLLSVGCEHEPAPASAFTPVGRPPPALSLHVMAPVDSAAMTRLWGALVAVEGQALAADALLELASRADDDTLRDHEGARRLVIEAIYRVVQSGSLGKQFERLRPIVDRLVRQAPTAPETRFALAYLRWIVLSDGKGGLSERPVNDDISRELGLQLGALVAEHPEFNGPGAFDAQRIAQLHAQIIAMKPAPPQALALPSPPTATAPAP